MNLSRSMVLIKYEVQFIDRREHKPRTVHTETVVLDGGRISALHRLGMKPAGYLAGLYEYDGFVTTSIKPIEKREIVLDLTDLWGTSPVINLSDTFSINRSKEVTEE